MNTQLPEYAKEKIITLIAGIPEVKRIILNGSRAKGTNRDNSDIDLCLDAPALSFKNLVNLENELDNVLLPWKIDLSILQHIANPDLVNHIKRVGIEWNRPSA